MKRLLCDITYCANERCHLRERCLRAVRVDCKWRPAAVFHPGELWCEHILPIEGVSDLDRQELTEGAE